MAKGVVVIKSKVFILLIFIFSYHVFSQCTRSVSDKYKTVYYECVDGSVSFVQPKSDPMVIEWGLVYTEMKTLIKSGEFESFPYQSRQESKKNEEISKEVIKEETVTKSKVSDLRTTKEAKSKTKNKKTFRDKIKDNYQALKENIQNYRKQIKVSEGKCGATAGANVFNAYCEGLIASPDYLMKNYFRDTSPGVLPETLKVGLNKLFNEYSECITGKWKYFYSSNKLDFLDSIYKYNNLLQSSWAHSNSPLIVLTGTSSGEFLHYITIIKISGYEPYTAKRDIAGDNCKVTYNDSSGEMQNTISCAKLVQLSENVIKNPIFKKVLKNYTRLVFIPY